MAVDMTFCLSGSCAAIRCLNAALTRLPAAANEILASWRSGLSISASASFRYSCLRVQGDSQQPLLSRLRHVGLPQHVSPHPTPATHALPASPVATELQGRQGGGASQGGGQGFEAVGRQGQGLEVCM